MSKPINFGWHYPPGAEHDPRAPWNERDKPDHDPDDYPDPEPEDPYDGAW